MIKLIKELKSEQNVIVRKIRCDNSGENVAFKNQAKEEGLGLSFEFTAHQMPQQNGRVERKYAIFIWTSPGDAQLRRSQR